MSIQEGRLLGINSLVDQIGYRTNVNFKDFLLSRNEVSELIRRTFPSIGNKAEEISNFCLQDVMKYYNKGVVIFIDGCVPGNSTIYGVNHREAFAVRLSYLMAFQMVYSQNVSDDLAGYVFNMVGFDSFADSVFNFDESTPVFNKLLSTQILVLSDINTRIFEKLTVKTFQKMTDKHASVTTEKLPERVAKLSSSIDHLISSRIRLCRPTIITVFDKFDSVFGNGCVGNVLKDLSGLVSEPKDVNDFSDRICLRGCGRLCLAYTEEYKRFGSGVSSESMLKSSLVKYKVNVPDSFFVIMKDECKRNNVRAEDVFHGLRRDAETLARVCCDDPHVVQLFFDFVVQNPRVHCVLKGVINA